MRIALISRGCRPGSGIELYTYELAKRLAARHEVHLLTNPGEVLACGAVVRPIRVFAKPLWHSIAAFSSRAGFEAQTGGYDVVHTQGSDGTWGDVVTAHSCHAAGMRASLRLDPSLGNRLRKALSPAHRVIVGLERTTFLSARHLVAVSRRVGRQLRAAYPGTREIPMSVIYPGVDADYFSPEALSSRRSLMRSELGLPPSAVVFTLLANAPRLKGALRLIHSLALTRQAQSHLLVATPQGPEAELRRLAGRLGLEKRVHFCQVGPDVLSVYAATDVQAGLPEYESFGLALLEAMACGRPLLLTRNAGAAELVRHQREGFLLPCLCGPRETAAAMDQLTRDSALRAAMGETCRGTAREHSWDRMVDTLEAVYRRVAEEKKIKL